MSTLPEVTVTAINPNRGNSPLHDFIRGVNSMRSDMMQKYNMSDQEWANISKQAVNLTGVESKNGTSIRFAIKNNLPDFVLRLAQKVSRGESGPLSRGLSQIKIFPNDTQLNKQYTQYGINDTTLKKYPKLQGKATVLKLLHNRQSMENNYTWKDGSPMSSVDANNIYWNRGRLTSGKNDKNDLSNSGVQYINKYNNRSIIR